MKHFKGWGLFWKYGQMLRIQCVMNIKIFKYFICFFYIYLEILKIKTRVNKKKELIKGHFWHKLKSIRTKMKHFKGWGPFWKYGQMLRIQCVMKLKKKKVAIGFKLIML